MKIRGALSGAVVTFRVDDPVGDQASLTFSRCDARFKLSNASSDETSSRAVSNPVASPTADEK